ncbi:MAG TPA: hypothetical protein PLQ20_01990 [Candidatus Paceibacterota bacterium]|nr:hypothetical protein [Candidatus Paceibacterota bacterium]
MQQKLFIDLNEDSNSPSKKIPKDHHYEEEFPDLDFILMPYAFILGIKNPKDINSGKRKAFLKELFSKNQKKHYLKLSESIDSFIKKESIWFKKDSQKALKGSNILSSYDLEKILASGVAEIKLRHKSLFRVKDNFRTNLPKSEPPLMFGKIARYLNNGANSEFWYEETGKEIAQLFPGFDSDLIASLLASTSIRADLPSNITKSFKALDQFFKNEVYVVPFGKRADGKTKETYFPGHLDASMHHLDLLKKGVPLTYSSEEGTKNGRKIKNFKDAMMSVNVHAIVDDIWLCRAFGCDRKRILGNGRIATQSPTDAIYDATEWYLQTLASLVAKKARGLCAMIWVGKRQETTKGEVKYTDLIKKRLDHGLFEGQYGNLRASEKEGGGIEFESL